LYQSLLQDSRFFDLLLRLDEDLAEEARRAEGCRQRTTPSSLRFLGPKVFFGAVVLLVAALRHGPTPKRLGRLCETFAVSVRTVRRWCRFWGDVCGEPRTSISTAARPEPPAVSCDPTAALPLNMIAGCRLESCERR
jgi:hypothetical protein